MLNSDNLGNIRQALLDCGQAFDSAVLFPTVIPEAAPLVVSDPYAFAIATCLDRGTKADIIWTIPYDIYQLLGHLDPNRIYQMSLEELADLFARLPRRPRYVNDAPRTIKELTRIVVEECGGDASTIWKDKRASEVKRTFLSIHGVGPGISSMAVLLIEAAFSIRFDDLDRRNMDIKPDVHTIRVLYRLGVSQAMTEQAAVEAARRLSPEYPGAVDAPLWNIGRTWCHAIAPNCFECCVESICAKRIE
jgi:endonuclease III